jgi:hypothetical protein
VKLLVRVKAGNQGDAGKLTSNAQHLKVQCITDKLLSGKVF